jgi:hypothetical protein
MCQNGLPITASFSLSVDLQPVDEELYNFDACGVKDFHALHRQSANDCGLSGSATQDFLAFCLTMVV